MNKTKLSLPALSSVSSPVIFIRQVRTELSKVDWPSREKTIRLTVIVVGASALVGLYIGALDTLFTLLVSNLVK